MKLNDLYLSTSSVMVVCRRGNDSQLAVRRLQQIFESQWRNVGGETEAGGGHENGPSPYSAGAVVVRDIIGGLDRWSREVDSTFPQY